jgi:hypothetical protein
VSLADDVLARAEAAAEREIPSAKVHSWRPTSLLGPGIRAA